MIETLKNKDGFVYAYSQYYIVNEAGDLDINGDRLFISEVWIHDEYRNTDCLSELCRLMFENNDTQKTLYVYWKRRKYGKMSKLYPISKFFKLIKVVT